MMQRVENKYVLTLRVKLLTRISIRLAACADVDEAYYQVTLLIQEAKKDLRHAS